MSRPLSEPPHPSFHTAELGAAMREMMRRSARWGGIWCVFPHPHYPGEYAVGLRDLARGPVLKESAGRPLPRI